MQLRQKFHEVSEQHLSALANDGECGQCGAVTVWLTDDTLIIVPGNASALTDD